MASTLLLQLQGGCYHQCSGTTVSTLSTSFIRHAPPPHPLVAEALSGRKRADAARVSALASMLTSGDRGESVQLPSLMASCPEWPSTASTLTGSPARSWDDAHPACLAASDKPTFRSLQLRTPQKTSLVYLLSLLNRWTFDWTIALSPHRSYGYSIDLLPGKTPPRGRLCPLSPLRLWIICPSSLPAAAVLFFVQKKDGSFMGVLITGAPTTSFSRVDTLVSSAFEPIHGASIISKMDLWNVPS